QARRPPHRFRPTPLVTSLSMIFRYHLRIGKVWTIRNEMAYPIHEKYPLCRSFGWLIAENHKKISKLAAFFAWLFGNYHYICIRCTRGLLLGR
ncbi:MAG: hypothetical protein SPG93_06155, partial [Prevotella sp.]|nr:hypothetical protein [Prevotella sp.]